MERWTIQDQVSLPYLLWREGITPGTFGIDQLENDMVVIMAHAEELRSHRTTILELESRAINATSRADYFEMMFHRMKHEHERLLNRKAVRLALAVAALSQPLRLRGKP
jgi:gamma-glutamyl phosphate reductase